MSKSKDEVEVEEILHTLAEELINYEQRMTEADAPPIRFVFKYTNKANKALTAWKDRRVIEGRLVELDLLEQAINQGRDMSKYKLQRLEDLENRLDEQLKESSR